MGYTLTSIVQRRSDGAYKTLDGYSTNLLSCKIYSYDPDLLTKDSDFSSDPDAYFLGTCKYANTLNDGREIATIGDLE